MKEKTIELGNGKILVIIVWHEDITFEIEDEARVNLVRLYFRFDSAEEMADVMSEMVKQDVHNAWPWPSSEISIGSVSLIRNSEGVMLDYDFGVAAMIEVKQFLKSVFAKPELKPESEEILAEWDNMMATRWGFVTKAFRDDVLRILEIEK